MRIRRVAAIVWFVAGLALAQQTAFKRERTLGTVSQVDAAGRKFVIKADNAAEKPVEVQVDAAILQIAPGARDLTGARTITLAGIDNGDRALVRGFLNSQGVFRADQVVLMSKEDLTKKQEAERAEWKQRGIAGKVIAVHPETREIDVQPHRAMGAAKLVIAVNDSTRQMRYSPDSIRYRDARPSRFEDIHEGDQIQALGSKNEDGTRLTAQQIISGAFHNIAAVVTAVDAASKTLEVKNLDGNKPVTVRIAADTQLRKMPPEMAQRLAMVARMRASGGGFGPPGGGPPGSSAGGFGPGAGPGGRPADPGGTRGGPPDIQSMLERMPAFDIAELKSGDALIIASSDSRTPGQVTAVTILGGVEPLLTAPAASQREMLGTWNLNTNMSLP